MERITSFLICLLYFLPVVSFLAYSFYLLVLAIKKDTNNPIVWDKSSKYLTIAMLIFLLIISLGLLIFEILFFLFPQTLQDIPPIFTAFGITGIMVFMGCSLGLLMGLAKSVGSGKKASIIFADVFRSLSKFIKKT